MRSFARDLKRNAFISKKVYFFQKCQFSFIEFDKLSQTTKIWMIERKEWRNGKNESDKENRKTERKNEGGEQSRW